MTDALLIALGLVCLLAGLVGCFLPVIPGPPIAYLGLLALHLTEKVQFSNGFLILTLALVLVVQAMDAFVPLIGARRFGGSRWGIWGCTAGTLAGLFFPPFGFIVGAFAGAVLGELVGGKAHGAALKAGAGAFLGFLAGTVIKLALCLFFIFMFAHASLRG